LARAVLYTPHPNQRIIHNCVNDSEHKYYVINIGRQFGKTLLGMNQMMHWALNERQVKIAWVSPVYKQSKKVFEETYKAFAKRPEIYREVNKSSLIIEYITGSTIQFFSAERYDNIRGFTFDYLIVDEFAFVDERAWTEVLRATVLVRGKKVLLISTPRGKNHFYLLHQLDGVNPQYKSFTMTSYDNPMINPTEIDDAKLTLPDHVFRQEYLAQFIEGGANIFKPQYKQSSGGNKFYGGVDLGRADDYSVLSIMNENGEQVFIDRWRHDSWTNISKKIADKINEYNALTYIEVNSIGDAIFEQVQNLCHNRENVQPFVTTSKTKQDIIEGLAVATQSNEVYFADVEWLKKEFEVFTFKYNAKSRSIKYGAPFGFHDDGVIATALSYSSLKVLKSSGEYYVT
jgi:hypothetical protein